MRPRRWLLPAVLAMLLSALALWPVTESGREWLLQQGVERLEDLGYRLEYAGADGNPWLGLELTDVRLVGPGVDVSTGHLRIDYFLPSLLAGELPVSITLEGLRGAAELDELQLPANGTSDVPVSVILRELSVNDVALSVDGIPRSLPALSLEDVSASRRVDGIVFEAKVRSDEGEARLAGQLQLAPWLLDMEVRSADVRLARHWWSNARAGTAQGRIVADESGVTADLTLTDAALTYLNLEFDEISGPVTFDRGLIEATLTGRGLDGPVAADIEVNVPARRWQANARGRPELAAVAAWLAPAEMDTTALAVTGSAETSVAASGWGRVTLTGHADGSGSLLQLPLDDLGVDFEFASGEGASVEATGTYAGGPLLLSITPSAEGRRVSLQLDEMRIAEQVEAAVELTTMSSGGRLTGRASGRLLAGIADRSITVDADATLDADGLQVFLDGGDDGGASVEGAAVLADGQLEGQLSLLDVTVPGVSDPFALSLRADGPIASLPLSLEIAGAGAEQPVLAGMRLSHSFAGRADGRLEAGEIRDVKGQFGPLAVTGRVRPAPLDFDLDYRLAQVTAQGTVDAVFGPSQGSVSVAGSELHFRGRSSLRSLVLEELELGPMDIGADGAWAFGTQDAANRFTFFSLPVGAEAGGSGTGDAGTDDDEGFAAGSENGSAGDGRLIARLDSGGATLSLDEPPLSLSGNPLALTGQLLYPFGGPARADFRLASEHLAITVEPLPGNGHRLRAQASPGLELGPLRLREPLHAVAEIAASLRQARLSGNVGAISWQGDLERGQDGDLAGHIVLSEGDRTLEIVATEGGRNASASGSFSIAPLAHAFGLPVSGVVESNLTRNGGEYAGDLVIAGTAADLPTELHLSGDDEELLLQGALTTAGVAWNLTGTIGSGSPSISATSRLGSLHVEGGSLQGSGTIPRQLGPVSLPAMGWTAEGSLADATASLRAADNRVLFDWSDGLTVQAEIDQDLALRDVPASLDLEATWRTDTSGRLSGELALGGPLTGHSLGITGNLDEIHVTGTLPATAASEALVGTGFLAGKVDLDVTIRPLAERSVEAAAALTAGESSLTARLSNSATGWSGTIVGPGLQAAFTEGTVSVEAAEVRLDPYLDDSWLRSVRELRSLVGGNGSEGLPAIGGDISWSRERGWQGELALLGEDSQALLTASGVDSELLLESAGDGDIRLRGKLLPSLDLEVGANQVARLVDIAGRISGSPRAPSFSGSVTVLPRALGPVALLSRTFTLEAQGESVVLTGDGTELHLEAGGISGNLALDLALAGEPHQLLAELSGSASHPVVEARVDGPLAQGQATWEGNGSARVELSLEPWLPAPLAAAERARLTATATAAGEWRVSGTAPLMLGGVGPVEAAVDLTGNGADYQGSGSLTLSDDRLLAVAVEGAGSAFTATADLTKTEPTALAALLPIDARLQPEGTISYASASGSLNVNAALAGEVADVPIDLDFSRAGDEPLRIVGHTGGTSVDFEFSSSGVAFGVTGLSGDADDQLEVNGAVRWDGDPTLTLTGSSVHGAVSGVGSYDRSSGTGTLDVSVGQSVIELTATGTGDDLVAITGHIDNGGEDAIGFPFVAEFGLTASPDAVVLDRLALHPGTDPTSLTLAGSAWPHLGLSGSLVFPPALGNERLSAQVDLTGTVGDPELLVSASGLSFRVSRGVQGWQGSLEGSTTISLGQSMDASVRSELGWNEVTGFSGDARLTIAANEADAGGTGGWFARGVLEGNGALDLLFALKTDDGVSSPLEGLLTIGPRPWADPRIAGEMKVSAHMEELSAGYRGRPLSMTGRIDVGGTLLEPSAAGELALAGALTAEGSLTYRAGEGELVLVGPHARMDAALARAGPLEATLAIDELPLGDLLPAAGGTRLSARVEIARGAEGGFSGTITGLDAVRGTSRVRGTANIGESVTASADIDIDLHDLPFGPPLSGTAAGSIAVTADGLDSLPNAILRGELKVREAGLQNGDEHLSGSVSVSGPVDDPRLRLDLAAGGRAGGALLVDAAPASGRFSLRGDLRWGAVETDVALAVTRNEIAAHGRVDLPGGHFVLTDRAPLAESDPAPAVQLIGFGRYRDWVFGFSPRGSRLIGQVALGTLDERLTGHLSLATTSREGEPWLQATVEGLAWQDVSVGDVFLESARFGSEITVTGENVRASISPSERLAWELEKLVLSGSAFDAVVAGRGSGTHGEVDVTTSFAVAGEPVSLPLTIRRDEDTRLAIAGEGSVLGGSLSFAAALPAEEGQEGAAGDTGSDWSGTFSAAGIEYLGTSMTAKGVIEGAAQSPTLILQGIGEGPRFSLDVGARLAVAEQLLTLTLRSPLLSSPLEIVAAGGTAPRLRATQADDQESFEIVYPEGLRAPPRTHGLLAFDLAGLGIILAAGNGDHVRINEADTTPAAAETVAGTAEEDQDTDGIAITVRVPDLEKFELRATLPAADLAAPANLLRRPLLFSGRDGTTGEVQVDFESLGLRLEDFAYRDEDIDLRLEGDVSLATETALPGDTHTGALARLRADVTGSIELLRSPRVGLLPALPANERLPFELSAEEGTVSLESSGHLGELRVRYDSSAGTAELEAAVRFGGGTADARFEFDRSSGPSGTLKISRLPLVTLDEEDRLRLGGELRLDRKVVEGNIELRSDGGSLQGRLTLGLRRFLPPALAPSGSDTVDLEMRLGAFDLETIPLVANRLPHLHAPVSGFLQVRADNFVARLVAPDLTAAGEPLPVSVDVNGTTDALRVDAVIAGSPIRFGLDGQGLSAFATLERFPLERLVEAVTGPVDVGAEVTGVARLQIPWSGEQGAVLELATELVRLERAGVETTGNVSLIFRDGELVVHQAEFDGAGQWRASGSLERNLLDFSLSAEDADFGPLLGLVPALARYSVTAQGSLKLDASGALSDPSITLTSPGLRFGVAGSRYLLEAGEVSLRGERLAVAARVSGVSPVTGQLVVAGGGNLELLPLRLQDARFTARGAADVPGLGEISDFSASVTSRPEVGLWLEGGGRLGEPFTVEGRLAPLDLAIQGDGLSLRLPRLLLASAEVDADIRMRWQEALRFSGVLDIDAARFELGIRPRTSEPRKPNPVAERFVFDDVAIRAPGRVRISENFGSAEVTLDLLLAGSAAQTRLSGTSQVLRGTFQFSGRDFEIESGEARFDPSRGVLPVLDVTAVTSFDMTRVQPEDGSVRFVAPQEGSRFEVTLAFSGEVEPEPGANPPFRLDLAPSLSSNALIQEVREDGITSGPRSLTEPELLSLITLGRLELNAPLAGQSGLATAVAEGAIDTAVDLLIVSELQTALAEALGVELVEIRTTALSSIFGRSASDPFSVSLRLGGYLSDEVFASYRIGSFDDVRGLYALTNEVSLTYELGPLELDLAGRVNFEDTSVPTPDAELSATVRYAFDELTSLETGVDLSNERQQVRFGVTLRW